MSKYKITATEYLKGREGEYPLTYEMIDNMSKLLVALNFLRDRYGKPLTISSGYRPGRFNTRVGGAVNSSHLTCAAADIADPDGRLKQWIAKHLEILDILDVWMEAPTNTPTWVHIDIKPRATRIFLP